MNVKRFLRFVTKILLLIVVTVCYVAVHETVHKQIMVYHGCTDARIEVHILSDSFTQCYSVHTQSLQETNLHCWNEIIGYTAFILYFPLFMLKVLEHGE